MVMTMEEFKLRILEKFPDADWSFFQVSDHPNEDWEHFTSDENRLVALVGDMFISYVELEIGFRWEIHTYHAGIQVGASLDEVDAEYLRVMG